MWTVDQKTLVPDTSLTIEQGAVAPWNSLMWSIMVDVCREMGVRTNVPFRDLTPREKKIVYHGPAEKRHIVYHNKKSNQAGELDFTYYNATYTVENALAKVKDERGMKRVEKFLTRGQCPDCQGTRLSEAARAPKLRGLSLDQACTMPLSDLLRMGAGGSGVAAGRDAPYGREHCGIFSFYGAPLTGAGARVFEPRSQRRYAFHRRAPAHAAGPRCAQPTQLVCFMCSMNPRLVCIRLT